MKQAPQSFLEIGLTGLRYWAGRLDEELLTELKFDQARKFYREMGENDPTIGALFNTITLLMRSVEWRVEGPGPKEQDDPRVELIESCMDDMSHSWSDLLSEIGRGTLQYGWQWHEIVYKRRVAGQSAYPDGQIGWKKLPVRAQDTLYQWDFDPTGGVQGFTQRPPPNFPTLTIPIEKSLLFRTETVKGSPEGRSILRNAYRPWYFKRNIENIEGIGVERDLAGFPVLRVPPNVFLDASLAAILEDWKRIATAVKRDEQEGLVLPAVYDEHGNPMYDLKLVTTGGQRQFNTTEIINRYDLRILQLMLADFIQLGHERTGSFAMHTSKTNLFAVAIGVFLDQIAEVFNRFAIPRLLELNGLELEKPPRLMHQDIESRNLIELADFLSKLSAAGMPLFPNPSLEAKLLDLGELPVPTPEEQAARDLQIQADQVAQAQALAATQPPPATNGKAQPPPDPAPTGKRVEPQIVTVEPHVTVTNAPQPITLTVEAPAAPSVHVEAPTPQHITLQAPVVPAPEVTVQGSQVTVAPVMVPAPAVTVEGTQVTVMPAPLPVIHVDAPVVKQGDTIVQLDVRPVAVAIDAAAEKLKRPAQLTVERDANGNVIRLTPEPPPDA